MTEAMIERKRAQLVAEQDRLREQFDKKIYKIDNEKQSLAEKLRRIKEAKRLKTYKVKAGEWYRYVDSYYFVVGVQDAVARIITISITETRALIQRDTINISFLSEHCEKWGQPPALEFCIKKFSTLYKEAQK